MDDAEAKKPEIVLFERIERCKTLQPSLKKVQSTGLFVTLIITTSCK